MFLSAIFLVVAAATTTETENTTTAVTQLDSVGPRRDFSGLLVENGPIKVESARYPRDYRGKNDGYRGERGGQGSFSRRKRNSYRDNNRNDGYGYGSYGSSSSASTCSNQVCYPPGSAGVGPFLAGQCVCGNSLLKNKRFNPVKDIGKAKSSAAGLCQKSYEGYWCNDAHFFKSNSYDECNVTTDGNIEVVNQTVSYVLSGYFRARKSGKYYFRTISSDASAILLNNVPIVENLFIHDSNECDSSVYLKKGYHPIQVYYGSSGFVGQSFKYVGIGGCVPANPRTQISATEDECASECASAPNCGAYSYSSNAGTSGACKLYLSAGPFTVAGSTNLKCYEKVVIGEGGNGTLAFEWMSDSPDASWTSNLAAGYFSPGKNCECANDGGYGSYGN